MRSRVVRLIQYLLFFLADTVWIYSWAWSLGIWVGPTRDPVLPWVALAPLPLIAAFATRSLTARSQPRLWVRVAVSLAGVLAAAAAAAPWLAAGGILSLSAFELGPAVPESAAILRALIAAGSVLFVWWRGIGVGRSPLLLPDAEGQFKLSNIAMAILLLIAAFAGEAAAPPLESLVLATLLTMISGLLAMPLARVMDESTRARHKDGTPLVPGGPWLVMLLGIVGTILLVTLLLSELLTFERIAQLLAPLLGLLDSLFWIVLYIVAIPLGLLAEGLFRLLRVFVKDQPGAPPPQMPDMGWIQALQRQQESGGPVASELLLAIKVVLAVALGLLVIWLLARAVSRFGDWASDDGVEEIHDSVWEWQGISLGRWLKERLLDRRAGSGETDPSAGGMRGYYREFLRLAAAAGHERRSPETPLEYETRLGEQDPLPGSDHTHLITDGYVRARYSQDEPMPAELDSVEAAVSALRSLWREHGSGA